jgi:hypothetical protein
LRWMVIFSFFVMAGPCPGHPRFRTFEAAGDFTHCFTA